MAYVPARKAIANGAEGLDGLSFVEAAEVVAIRQVRKDKKLQAVILAIVETGRPWQPSDGRAALAALTDLGMVSDGRTLLCGQPRDIALATAIRTELTGEQGLSWIAGTLAYRIWRPSRALLDRALEAGEARGWWRVRECLGSTSVAPCQGAA